VLAGGVGAARFLQGVLAIHRPSDITIISNVGDDAEFFGLHVSPDIDIVLYHLAGLSDEERGFGLKGDTFNVIDAIARYGYDTWFRLGDRDLATCITRTDLLRRGRTLSEATAEIASALLVPARIIPVTDDPLRTKVRTDEGLLDFQDYFVRRRTEGHTREIIFDGAETSRPAPGILEAILEARAVIFSPSNPLVSIGPVLSVPGVREALKETPAKVAAVSPIVGGKALKGPADRMLRDQGMEPSAVAVAQLYVDFLDLLVIDNVDAKLKPEIESLGVDVLVTDTIMDSMEKKAALGRAVLNAVTA
ncbi:MAG TPA: 2-phospho-L-lactate transferase, partial [Dehalococcoidia bacterium]|nr:2-phospho-L-lactate transferase [Dehalococcoidia bacterium]